MRGTIGYFLVDSGAVVMCVGRQNFDSLSNDKVFFDNSVRPVTVTGAPLRTSHSVFRDRGGNVSLCPNHFQYF